MTPPPTNAILLLVPRSADAEAVVAALPPDTRALRAQTEAEAHEHIRHSDVRLIIADVAHGIAEADGVRRGAADATVPLLFVSRAPVTEEIQEQIYALDVADFVLLTAPRRLFARRVELLLRWRETEAGAPDMPDGQHERYRLLSEAASDYALFFLDPQGVVTEWSVSAEQLFGFRGAEIVGQPGAVIFTPEERARGEPEKELEDAVAHGQTKDNRFHVRQDGTRFPAQGRMVALRGRDGHLRGFAKIVRNATTLLQLEENERRFRQIFETAHEGIWMLDAHGRVEIANERMAEMLGCPRAELVGQNALAFAFPEDVARMQALFEQRRAGRAMFIEIRFRRRTGETLWALLSSRPLFRDGAFSGTLDMFSDLTTRRFAEERFRVFFESSAAGHAVVDPATGRYLHVNRRWCEMLGRSPEELLQLTYRDVTHPADRVADATRFAELLAGNVGEVVVEKRYLRADGTCFWGHLTSSIVRNKDGVPELQFNTVQDITARRLTAEELQESQTRLRLALEAAELGIYYYDEVTGENIWDDQARRLFGFGADETVTADAFLSRVHPDDRGRMQREVESIRHPPETTREFEYEYRVVLPDGIERFVAAHGISQSRADAEGHARLHLVGTLRDVTAIRQAELDLRNKVTERTRELAEKTRQLDGFIYTVAHDLRAPLRSINGFAELLAEEFGTMQRDEALGLLERIKSSTRRMDVLIRDLVGYSRVSQVDIELEDVDLTTAAHAAVRELKAKLLRTKAEVTIPVQLPKVRGERAVVEQVILNLLSNAVKFARPGEPPKVDIAAHRRGGWVRLEVRDEGIGIAPQYHSRIFNVFERLQTARYQPGTGIGLAIVAKGMERLGGRYGVESAPGAGSVFWLEFKPVEP